MRSVLGLLALVGLMLGNVLGQEAPKPDEATKKDQEALQGTWELEKLEVSGKKTLPEDLKKAVARIVIEGGTIAFEMEPSKNNRKGTFTIDASKMPRWIDMEDSKKNKEPGIYEITGDTLKVCAARPSAERPKEFATKAMSDTYLMEFKRVKKK